MADKELVEGLRTALARGESLEEAMYTFYNAGYKKEKIEEAARALVYQEPQRVAEKPLPVKQYPKAVYIPQKEVKVEKPPQIAQIPQGFRPLKPAPQFVQKTKPPAELYTPPKETLPRQIVSGYEKREKPPKRKLVIILLIVFLILLLGALVAVFIFREDLLEIFNNLLQNF